MSLTNKLTGKAAYLTISGTQIPFTKIGAKTERKLADATDSTDYDVATDLIWPTQLPVSASIELSVEGRYNLVSTPGTVIATLYSGATAVPCVFGLSGSAIYGHGNFDLSNFQADVPVDDIVTFTASLKSNGKFTPGS